MCKASALACASLSLAFDEIGKDSDVNITIDIDIPAGSLGSKRYHCQMSKWRSWFGVEENELQEAKMSLVLASRIPKTIHMQKYQ